MLRPRFAPGEAVRVKALYPPGHVRTPFYLRGRQGVVATCLGTFGNPEALAYGRRGEPPVPLYRVRFRQRDLWPDYAGRPDDTLLADIFETWLEPEVCCDGSS
jgi:hypothetical protein